VYQSPPAPVNVEDKPVSELGKLHKILINSKSFKESMVAMHTFVKKLRPGDNTGIGPLISSEVALMHWIKDNIKKTDFKDYDEAVSAYKLAISVGLKCREENKEFYKLYESCTDEDELIRYIPYSDDEGIRSVIVGFNKQSRV
jgi:hypothetical protein